MLRTISVIVLTAIAVMLMFVAGAPILEGVGEAAKASSATDNALINGIVSTLLTDVAVLLLFGFGVLWPAAWIMRRERNRI